MPLARGTAPGGMKAAVFLLLALKVPACHTGAQCNIDNMVDLKVQAAVSSIVSSTLAKAKLLCQDVSARGALVSCPTGYKPMCCACGMGCGSWDIRTNSTCHCQCGNIDWTAARCCKIGLE
ncbi:resistin isoform X3 [Trachemys scripta elegans]|uniref:resistin isoform X3 n=1 Tax=Trachemys scripta elegans TaxID=31138 RepID=UPI001554009A|nr:resistin isoform X3 [Trachemys scripta elegans]